MFEKVKELIVSATGVDAEKVTAEASFKEDLQVDSLDLFELVMNFEEEFEIEIPTEELEQITTVGAFVKYIEGKVA